MIRIRKCVGYCSESKRISNFPNKQINLSINLGYGKKENFFQLDRSESKNNRYENVNAMRNRKVVGVELIMNINISEDRDILKERPVYCGMSGERKVMS